ncbi:MAG TPA: response regulator transcription factor [Phycisphaerae bacterium]|jgi:DNA-binding NarL/FixJ family response regulator
MPIRIMLVDDHQMVLEGLKQLLAATPEIQVVAEARTGEEALALVQSVAPDVMVLDVTMPGLNGIETMRQIRLLAPETEVIGLSMHAAAQVVSDMIRAGASGYMLKSASVDQLACAIRTVMTGQTYFSPEIADLIPDELLRGKPVKRVLPGQEIKELTPREREVLKWVAEGKSSKEIATALFVTTKTIVWHRQSIMDKLDLRTVAELTKYAVRMGLTTL